MNVKGVVTFLLLCNLANCVPQERDGTAYRESVTTPALADTQLKKMVALDLELRQLATLEYGEQCDPSRQALLDNPPISPTAPTIISWLRNLLTPPRTLFCNYLLYLQCSSETWACTCREGLVQSPQGVCVIQAGTNCGTDFYFRNLYFDPLLSSTSLVIQPPPACAPGLSCCHRPLFFRKKCWCRNTHAQDQPCDDSPIFSQKSEYPRLLLRVKDLFRLRHGETCDPEIQRQILDPPEYDLIDTRGRVIYLEQLLRTPVKLCDISKHLNCSDFTRQCECWRSTDGKQGFFVQNLGECVGSRVMLCGNTSLEAPFYPPASPTVLELQNAFTIEKGLEVKCGSQGTRCLSHPVSAQYCACSGHFFGDNCTLPGSSFTRSLQNPKVFHPELTKLKVNHVYDQVNEKLVLLEQRFGLGLQSNCEHFQESKMDRIQSFWRNFSSYWGIGNNAHVVEPSSTLQILTDVMDVGIEILENEQLQLCDRKQGLCCSEKGKCICPKGAIYQHFSCRIQVGHKCELSHVAFRRECVLYANCVEAIGVAKNLETGICECLGDSVQTESNGSVICEKPKHVASSVKDKLPAFGRSLSRNAVMASNPPLFAFSQPATFNLIKNPTTTQGSRPKVSQHHPTNLIHDKLLEIATHRSVSVDGFCSIKDHAKFRIIAQNFSNANKFHRHMDAGSVDAIVHDLSNVLSSGDSVCDVRKHLECSPLSGKCWCLPGLALNDHQECRIQEGKPCTISLIHLKVRDLGKEFIIALPKCDLGLPCVFNDNINDTICTRLHS